jgi:hypothetical protein
MTDNRGSAHEDRLNEVLLAYLEGGAGDPAPLQLRYPDLADELADFVACREVVEGLAAPLRQAFLGDPEAYSRYELDSSFGGAVADLCDLLTAEDNPGRDELGGHRPVIEPPAFQRIRL